MLLHQRDRCSSNHELVLVNTALVPPTCACPQNFVALVPLALVLGEVTEDLAVRFGDTVGGLLNATFGNVVELVLSLAALSKGLFLVVAMSLIGSILSNLLLVLGERPGALILSVPCHVRGHSIKPPCGFLTDA